MGAQHAGFMLRIDFGNTARRNAWSRVLLVGFQEPVASTIDALKARPLFQDAAGGDVELFGAVEATEADEVEKRMEALAISAGEKGAHAELSRFPLQGAVTCRVWDARRRKLVERPPEAKEVKGDHLFAQKQLREAIRIQAPKAKVKGTAGLACVCGAAVDASATACRSCRQSFAEPIALASAPKGASAVTLARESLVRLGLEIGGGDFRSFALLRPRNARQWLETREVLTRAGFKLLATDELNRRARLLQQASAWPRSYRIGGVTDNLSSWAYAVARSAGAESRPVLEKLGREHLEALVELSRDLRESDRAWTAAAQLAGVELDGLDDYVAPVAFGLPVLLASPDGRKRLGLKEGDRAVPVRALGAVAPDLLTPMERADYLDELEYKASCLYHHIGAWLDGAHRAQGAALAATLRRGLKAGLRPDAQERSPGFCELVQKVIDWAVEPSAVPDLSPLGQTEVLRALEELKRQGLPPGIEKRVQAARGATPPYGLKPLQAWVLEARQAAKPSLECPECGASMRPKAEIAVPQLGPKLGKGTIRVYECDACAADGPSADNVHVTIEPGVAGKAREPEAFLDYPERQEAEAQRPSGFMGRHYEAWLKQSGLPKKGAVQLGGYPHGVYEEALLIGVSCRHAPTLLQLEPGGLGLKVPKLRIALSVCMHLGCKKPGLSEVVTY